jgi:hypothetical protein
LQSLHQSTRRFASLTAIGVAALTLLLLGTSALGADAISTGSPLYAVQNSNGPGGAACLTVSSNATGAFRVNSTSFHPNAPLAPAQPFIGFKAIYTGCRHGFCLEPHYPALASSITSEPTSWTYNWNTVAPGGMYDAVYDMNFTKTSVEQTLPTGAELEVWLNHTSNLKLEGAGTLPDVEIDGAFWHISVVYKKTPLGNWNRIAFERVDPTTSVTGLDMAPFIRRAESYGAISPNWYQQNLEAGFEIWSGGTGLATSSFSATPPKIVTQTVGGKDRTKPTDVLSLPVCSITYSAHKCAALRRTAGAWETVSGFASDDVDVKSVTVTAIRKADGNVAGTTVTSKAKLRGTAFQAKLSGLTTGSWTFTAEAVDSSGNTRTTKPIHVDINYGLSPTAALPSKTTKTK